MSRAICQAMAGAILLVFFSRIAGASALGADAGRKRGPGEESDVVMLPPYQVEDKVRWFYARGSDMEVLSQWSKGDTTRFMTEYAQMKGFLDEVLPPRFQARSDVPGGFILFADKMQHSAAWRHLVDTLEKRQAANARQRGARDRAVHAIEALPNFSLTDLDADSVFVVADGDALPPSIKPTPDYVRALLESRTPPLPAWYVAGMRRLLLRFTTKSGSSHAPERFGPAGFGGGLGGVMYESGGGLKSGDPRIGRQIWMNPQLFARLLKPYSEGDRWAFDDVLRATHTQPLPLAELFAGGHPESDSPFDEARRRETAVLFLRLMLTDWKPLVGQWQGLSMASYGVNVRSAATAGGLADDARRPPFYADRVRTKLVLNHAAADALWRFVEQATAGPVTEDIFRQCFGLSFSEADAAMRDALYFMFNNSINLNPVAPAGVQVRIATPEEVGRIKGDFNRLEIRYVRANCPEVTGEFVEQARRTLWESYDGGDRDPRLLAELGLFECDVNEDAKAVPYLEAAVSANVIRPRAYYELAWIRWAGLHQQLGPGKLTREQLASVLAPLQIAVQQAPQLPEIYNLEAEAWLHADIAPTGEELAELRRGALLFPGKAQLIETVALVHANNGQWQAAKDLVAQGLLSVTALSVREELTQFQHALDKAQLRSGPTSRLPPKSS